MKINLDENQEKEKLQLKIEGKIFLKDEENNEDKDKKANIILNEVYKNLENEEDDLFKKEIDEIKKHKDFFHERNFILTELSCKRMAQIIHYINARIPVLLEGDTGTAKTRTSVIACEYLMEYNSERNKEKGKEKNYIIFNLSAETKVDN